MLNLSLTAGSVILSLLSLLLLVFIVYLAGVIISGRKLITSRFSEQTVTEADQYYYLPQAELALEVTVSYTTVYKSADNTFVSAAVYQAEIETTAEIIADDEELLALSYHPSAFANDEIRMTTNRSGLLENVSITVEDRIVHVLSQISDAPHQVAGLRDSETESPFTIKNYTATRSFRLSAEDMKRSEVIKSWWIIPENVSDPINDRIDASLRFVFKRRGASAGTGANEKGNVYAGLLTRPLCNFPVSVYLAEQSKADNAEKMRTFRQTPDLEFNIAMPDRGKMVFVPVSRALFIKKTQAPKFSSGMLTENYINKPSEAEAFLSIPIIAAKAVFSIPAQLLSFKINHVEKKQAKKTA